jgi:hypothetical protein
MLIIALFILLTSVFSICWTGRSSCAHLLSGILYIAIILANIILGFYIVFDQESLVDFMTEKMDDSVAAIDKIKYQINVNLDIVKILFLSYTIVIVKILI